jgi:hypothetical protein
MFYKETNQNSLSYSSEIEKTEFQDKPENNEFEKVEGTPFFIVKNNEDGTEWILTFGTYKLKTAKTKRELKEYLITDRYNIMTDIVIIINEVKEKNSKTKNQ